MTWPPSPDAGVIRAITSPALYAIARHTVLVMNVLAICAVTAALLRRRTDTRAPAPHRADQPPPADPGMIPLTVPETARLLAHPPPLGTAGNWLAWRRRHQSPLSLVPPAHPARPAHQNRWHIKIAARSVCASVQYYAG
jgi:hypothetical protein